MITEGADFIPFWKEAQGMLRRGWIALTWKGQGHACQDHILPLAYGKFWILKNLLRRRNLQKDHRINSEDMEDGRKTSREDCFLAQKEMGGPSSLHARRTFPVATGQNLLLAAWGVQQECLTAFYAYGNIFHCWADHACLFLKHVALSQPLASSLQIAVKCSHPD